MSTTLDTLLIAIDPARTLDETAARADAALNAYRIPQDRVTTWSEFTDLMADFLIHVEMHVLRLRAAPDASGSFQWDRCAQHLRKLFGRQGND